MHGEGCELLYKVIDLDETPQSPGLSHQSWGAVARVTHVALRLHKGSRGRCQTRSLIQVVVLVAVVVVVALLVKVEVKVEYVDA